MILYYSGKISSILILSQHEYEKYSPLYLYIIDIIVGLARLLSANKWMPKDERNVASSVLP